MSSFTEQAAAASSSDGVGVGGDGARDALTRAAQIRWCARAPLTRARVLAMYLITRDLPNRGSATALYIAFRADIDRS